MGDPLIQDRVFVLTGCASGIGRRLAESIAQRGGRLLATDAREDALAEVARAAGWKAPQVETRRLDVRDPAAWEEALDLASARWGRIDVLMNIAGVLIPGYCHEQPVSEIELTLDVNLKGLILGTRAAARRMVAQGGGHIVNIASMGAIAPVPGLGLYSATKFAVRAFSITAAMDLRDRGVFVTAVCPMSVRTAMWDQQVSRPEATLYFLSGRPLTVDDVERVILGRVLRKRPMEAVFPFGIGLLAKSSNLFPGLARRLAPLLERIARRRQEAERRSTLKAQAKK